jgi:hypothetical protein
MNKIFNYFRDKDINKKLDIVKNEKNFIINDDL